MGQLQLLGPHSTAQQIAAGTKQDKKRRYPACKLARMAILEWKAMRQGRMMREAVVLDGT